MECITHSYGWTQTTAVYVKEEGKCVFISSEKLLRKQNKLHAMRNHDGELVAQDCCLIEQQGVLFGHIWAYQIQQRSC